MPQRTFSELALPPTAPPPLPQFSAAHATVELLGRANRGDSDAWTELYRRYRPMLVVLLHTRLPGVARNFDADDVLQSAFLLVWDQLRGFEYRGEGSFRRWLATLVLNKLRDKLRHEATRKNGSDQRHSGDPEPALARVPDLAPDPAEFAALQEQHRLLLEHLGRLSDEAQEVISMKIFERLPWAEIGENLALSESGARARFEAAMSQLSSLMRASQSGG